MKAAKKPAGAKCTADAAELRKVQPDRPERMQRRGAQAGKEEGENCGKTAEKLRNLSLPSVSPPESGALPPSAPSLVKRRSAAKRREEAPGAAPCAAKWQIGRPGNGEPGRSEQIAATLKGGHSMESPKPMTETYATRLAQATTILEDLATHANSIDDECCHFYGELFGPDVPPQAQLLLIRMRRDICRLGWMADLAIEKLGGIQARGNAEDWMTSPAYLEAWGADRVAAKLALVATEG